MRAARPKAAIAVVAVAALAVAGCAESDRDNEGSGQSTRDTLVFGTAGDPKVLDPSLASDGESLRVARQIFEPGSKPYSVLSGVTDLAADIWADPGAAALGSVGKARRASKMLEAAGAVDGLRPTVLTELGAEFTNSRSYRKPRL